MAVGEQAAVMARYEDLLIDPPASYLAHTETTVPLLDPAELTPRLRATLAKVFDGLPAG